VLTAGYARSADARAEAKAYAVALQAKVNAPVSWYVLDARADQAAIQSAIAGATGVWLTGPDQSLILPALSSSSAVVNTLRTGWMQGKTLLADNAAAAALGERMTVDAPPTADSLEEDAIIDFRPDGVAIQPGLAFVRRVAVEPRLLPDRHWGRLYNLIADAAAPLGVGVDVGTALELSSAGATVYGTSAAALLDGRYATFATGSNGALSARYVLLDTFVDGTSVQP
jgi:cyanophycinase-like exopeptidase